MLNERIVAQRGPGVLVLDRRGRVQFANRAVIDLLVLGDDPVGSEVRQALAGHPGLAEWTRDLLAAPGPRLGELSVVTAGPPRRILAHATPLEGDAEASGVLLTLLDVTGLRAEDNRARGAATLEGLSRLTGHIAHELKNPLGALKLYALLLQRQSAAEKGGRGELAEKVARTVDHLSTVVGEITAMVAAGPVEPDRLAPATVLDDCLAATAERLKSASIEVVRRDTDAGLTAWADAGVLRRIIATVVANAVDAMPEGGTLAVGVAPEGSGDVAVTVQDSGQGMSDEARARLFEPFFTTKTGGKGLGLALARQLIEQQGGRLEVDSRPGAGTTVRVVLPTGTQAESHGRRAHPGH